MFTCQWSWEKGVQLAEELGSNVFCLRTAISTQSDAAVVAKWVARHTDGLDLLVCSASTFSRASIEDTRPDIFKDFLESNLTGPYFLIQQCLPQLRHAKGCVVNISDSQATGGVPYFSAYLSAKAALISVTKSLAMELAPLVRVNAVLPGCMDWPANETTYSIEDKNRIVQNIPMQRTGAWSDLVHAVAYLESAPYVSGACTSVDGGSSAGNCFYPIPAGQFMAGHAPASTE